MFSRHKAGFDCGPQVDALGRKALSRTGVQNGFYVFIIHVHLLIPVLKIARPF